MIYPWRNDGPLPPWGLDGADRRGRCQFTSYPPLPTDEAGADRRRGERCDQPAQYVLLTNDESRTVCGPHARLVQRTAANFGYPGWAVPVRITDIGTAEDWPPDG